MAQVVATVGAGVGLCGFITEANLEEAEAEFPGITAYYLTSSPRPKTFLDLVHAFETGVLPCGTHVAS